jgi:hypothetical protein
LKIELRGKWQNGNKGKEETDLVVVHSELSHFVVFVLVQLDVRRRDGAALATLH